MSPAVIIGGGPAGSAMAIRLARHGVACTLIEKTSSPHDKMCGEFISIEAQEDLRAFGIDLLSLGAVPIGRLRLIAGRNVAEAALPFTAMSLSRARLDEALLKRAGECGAAIRRGASVAHLGFENGPRVRLESGESIAAEQVFLATGKHNLRGWPRDAPKKTAPLGFKMHFRLHPAARQAIEETCELYLFPGGYAGLEPIEQGKANLCLVIDPARFTACGRHWPGVLAMLGERLPLLAERLRGSVPCWSAPLAIAGIPYGYLRRPESAPPNFFPLGDQMAVIPSFCGDGLAIALHTAALAEPFALSWDSAGYRAHAFHALRPPMRRAGGLARLSRNAAGQHLLVSGLNRFPQMLAPLVWQTRAGQTVAEKLSSDFTLA